MNAVDASVLIAQLDQRDAHHTAAAELLTGARGPLVVSPITLAEVLAGPARAGREHAIHDAIRGLGVRETPWPEGTPVRLAQLRASTGLKLPDCCVLLAAESVDARAVLTFDDRLARAARDAGFDVP